MLNLQYLPIPISVNWNLTDMCNFECKHCYSSEIRRTKRELSTEEVIYGLKKLKKAGVEFVTFGGGESLLRADIWEILGKCHELNLDFRIITNGYIVDKQICTELKKNNIMELLISLDGPNSYIHDKFRNKNGSFERVVNAIKQAQKQDIDIMILTNLNKYNYKYLQDFFPLIENLNIKKWRINEIKELGNGAKNCDSLSLSKDEVKECHLQLFEFEKSNVCSILYDSIFCIYKSPSDYEKALPGCHCGRMSLALRPNGDICPCVYYDIVLGNILKDKIESIWNESEILKEIRNKKPEGKCLKCKFYNNCRGGCFARSYLVYGDINQCDPLCWLI